MYQKSQQRLGSVLKAFDLTLEQGLVYSSYTNYSLIKVGEDSSEWSIVLTVTLGLPLKPSIGVNTFLTFDTTTTTVSNTTKTNPSNMKPIPF